MKHQIKHRATDAVIFECDLPDDVQASGLATRYALEQAVHDGANLVGANLARANLVGANLVGANLARADLVGANLARANLAGAYLVGANLVGAYLARANLAGAYLVGANLVGAYLVGANLVGADLVGANLVGANLAGAKFDGAKFDEKTLVGERPVLMIGPIGSRSDYFTAYLTGAGVVLRAGCFTGTVAEFREKLIREHGNNKHATEYNAALDLIECHAKIWTPETSQEQA